ncbi:MAG: sulfotransferase [Magnetococcales bacterium]|nr:sulfotransferase [Magnetococcales bacterium]
MDTKSPRNEQNTPPREKSPSGDPGKTASQSSTPPEAIAALKQGVAHHQTGQLDQAIAWYRRTLTIDPQNINAMNNIGAVLKMQGKLKEAEQHLKRALAINPHFASAHNSLGVVLKNMGRLDEAIRHLRQAIALQANYANAHHNLANALLESGHLAESEKHHRKVLAIKPNDIISICNISYLHKHTENDDLIRTMESLLANTPSQGDQINLNFTLGKAMADLGQYSKSFQYFAKGNALKRESFQYNIETSKNVVRHLRELCTAPYLEERKDSGHPNPTPIFIIGMIRSGTSLLEQILASHPKVYGGGELNFVNQILFKDRPFAEVSLAGEVPNYFSGLNAEEIAQLGAEYIGKIRELSADAVHIVDKMPFNFLYIGLIRTILPQARFIHIRRSPLDTCLSIYRINFGNHLPFAYDLTELGQYYRLYLQMMAHWNKVLPGVIHEISYEELTANQEQETRRVLAFCDLEWDDCCLHFHKTNRPVRTASFQQVRRSMYQTSVDGWKRYKDELQPLIMALGDAVDDVSLTD